MQRILGLDLDGTLADHTTAKITLAEEYGYQLKPHQTSSKELRSRLPADVYEVFRNKLYRERAHLSPTSDGVIESLKALSMSGWDFMIISRRFADSQDPAREWIQRELDGLIADRQVAFVIDDEQKDTAASIYGVSVYVDDQARVLRMLPSVETKILFNPFGDDDEEGMLRMKHWGELPTMLGHLFGGSSDV